MILLSHIIDSDTPAYGNRDRFIIEEASRIADGASANSSKWTFTTNHLGTHIDMPKHFFDRGLSLTDMPLEFWISDKVQLINVPCISAKLIEVDDLSHDIYDETEVLLLRTGYENFRKTDKYWDDNPGLSSKLGFWLRKNSPKLRVVGFDFISLTSWKHRTDGKIAHQAFLNPEREGNPICIIEDMALKNIRTHLNKIIVSPLFVEKANGSPVTIFGFKG